MLKKAILMLSITGFVISLYLFYEKITGGSLVCGISSCETVNNSGYSTIFNIPVSFFGMLYYLSIISFVKLKKYKILFLSILGGFIFSLYLTFLEAFVIEAWCQWCIISALIVTAQLGLIIRLKKSLV